MEHKGSRKLLAVFFFIVLSVPVLMINLDNAVADTIVGFSADFADGTADDWTAQVGSWKVTNEKYYVSVGIVENGISTVNGKNLADYVIETQLEFTDVVGFRAGLVFRYIDNQHYYSFELSNEYDTLDLIKYTPQDPNYGDGSGIAQLKPFPIQSGRAYQLKVVVTDNLFQCYVDGQKVLSGTENEYTYGTVGLRARSADAYFDNFKIYDATSAISQTPTPVTSLAPSSDQLIGTYTDDFSKDSDYWQYTGDAHRDSTNQYVILTPGEVETAGVALFNVPISGGFKASFRYKAGEGGYNGDGFTFFFYKKDYYPPGRGANLGFTTLNSLVTGYGAEFDGWQNIPYDFNLFSGGQQNPQGDPSNGHVALIKDFAGNHLAYVNDLRVTDGKWHHVEVGVQGSNVRVTVDNDVIINWTGELDRTYSGLGFSAGNGQVGSNWHIIDDFSIITQELKKPRLTASCVSTSTDSSFDVKINGDLTFDEKGISGAPIRLSYSLNDGDSWQDLTTVHTDSAGAYSALWKLSVTGDYLLKAVFNGTQTYLATSRVVNFAIQSIEQQSVFSVNSNSTITELAFDSTNKELSFGVSGESGTGGYVEVYIPKSLLSDVSTMKAYLDSDPVDYTTKEQGDCWLLYFTYHHSSHAVTIQLNAQGVFALPPVIIVALIVCVVLAGASLVYVEYKLYHKNKPKKAQSTN